MGTDHIVGRMKFSFVGVCFACVLIYNPFGYPSVVEVQPNDDGTVTNWISGAGAGWTAQSSPLTSYCAMYDLCNLSYVYDGTSSDLQGKSIDFAGPNYVGSGPWYFQIDMGNSYTYSTWRIAGSCWHMFGAAYLQYHDGNNWQHITGSDVTNTQPINSSPCNFVDAKFSAPVTARYWAVAVITTTKNTNFQSRFQLYLSEVQFGYVTSQPSRVLTRTQGLQIFSPPTPRPVTATPTAAPTPSPSSAPTTGSTPAPTLAPIAAPTTPKPTPSPTAKPTSSPTKLPTDIPTVKQIRFKTFKLFCIFDSKL